MNFPDRIFAVGGAGKAIAYKILELDWVLDDILKPRPNPASLTITIIDTAEGEENTDRRRIQEFREKIKKRKQKLMEENSGRPGTIDVKYKLITDDLHLAGSIDLVGEAAVPRITAGNGMPEENWWIKERHINENLDFAKGVVRKRGLGKAIYYKAYAEDDDISAYIDLPQKGRVALLAGLGGGTGSGILLDLAQHLQEKQRTAEITLFGVLPNHTEGVKENTNAYAALSEIEYNALEGSNVFKDRVLIPIDPTNFDGKTGDTIQTGQLLEELDEAIVYLLSSYYNTEGLEDPFANTPDYAPFTIGIPQVLRYNVEAINEAREQFRDALNNKNEALQAEEEVYSKLDRFLTKHYDPDAVDTEAGLRDLDQTDLTERLERAESWLDYDLFNELEYHSLSIFEDIIQDGKDESEDVTEQIDIISGSLRAVDVTSQESGTFVDNIDEHLAEVLERELQLISRRKELMERRKVIEDTRIRDAVEYLMGIGDAGTAPGVKLQRLEAKLEDLTDQRETLVSDLRSVEQELEEKRDEQSAEVEEQTSNWVREIEEEIERLQELDVDAVESHLSSLQPQLDKFAREVANAVNEEEIQQAPGQPIRDTLDALAAELEPAGIDMTEHRNDTSGSLTELKQAKEAFLLMNKEEGTIESILPGKSDTEEQREEANRDYRIQKNNLADRGIFEIGPPTGQFDVSVNFSGEQLLRMCRQTRQQNEESVIETLRERVEKVPPEQLSSLEGEVASDSPDIDRLREIAGQVIRIDVGETDEIERRKSELKSELDELETQIDVYDPAIEMFQTVNSRRETWQEKNNAFEEHRAETSEQPDQVATQEDNYVYVKNVKPDDIFRATGRDNIAESDLFKSDEENRRLESHLEELAKNTRNQTYTGLYRRKIAKGGSRYSGLKVRVAVSSPAIGQIDKTALDFEDGFQGAFDLGAGGNRVESRYTSWSQEIGGPWDISLSVFITGIFLDNIRKAVQADGYKKGYDRRHADLGDDILIHHSYQLEDGSYLRRKKLLNLESDEGKEFYLRSEREIVDDLLDNYVETLEVQ